MDDEPDHQDKRWVAFLNYGPLLNNASFDRLVYDLEQAGVIAFPEVHWIN